MSVVDPDMVIGSVIVRTHNNFISRETKNSKDLTMFVR